VKSLFFFVLIFSSASYGNDLFQLDVYGKGVADYQFNVNHLEMKIRAKGFNRRIEFNSCNQKLTSSFIQKLKTDFKKYKTIKGAKYALKVKMEQDKKDVLVLSSFGKYLKNFPKKFLFLEKDLRKKCEKS